MKQNEFERIEAYLLGEMTAEEQIIFEQELEQNPTLKTETEELKTLIESVETSSIKELLNDFHKEIENQKVAENPYKKILHFSSWKWVAAACILLLVGAFWFFKDFTAQNNLYKKYYEQDPGLPTVMGETDNYKFYEGMVDYKQGNFDNALENWTELLEKKPTNDTLNYFAAMAYLGKNELEKAENYLIETQKISTSNFKNDAAFYLALIYLNQNKTEKAKEILQNSSHPKVREILSELD